MGKGGLEEEEHFTSADGRKVAATEDRLDLWHEQLGIQ